MAVQSEINNVSYAGHADVEVPYVVPFNFFDNADVKVVLTNEDGVDTILSEGTDYTVSGAGDEDGGLVYAAQPIAETSKLTIYRELRALQDISYEEGDQFPAASHERALDRLTMLVQQTLRAAKRSLRVRESDGNLVEAARVANSMLGLNAAGAPVFRTADEVVSFLNLTESIFDRPMMTFADAGERALAVPNFTGQLGTQRDSREVYLSTGTAAGEWILFLNAALSITTGMLSANVLTADAAGLSKMADGYLSASAAGRAKMADEFLSLAKIGSGIFTADTAGRAKFAAGFVSGLLLAENAAIENLPSGAIIQSVYSENRLDSTVPGFFPYDNTLPEITEGVQILAATITPKYSTSKIRIKTNAIFGGTTGEIPVAAIFRNGVTYALAADWGAVYTSRALAVENAAGTTDPITYSVRVGVGANSGSVHVNNHYYYTPLYGDAMVSTLHLEEIKS